MSLTAEKLIAIDFLGIPTKSRWAPLCFQSLCDGNLIISMFSAQATTVITANEAVRDGKIIPLKAMVDEAVEECDCVKQVFVAQRTGVTVPMYGRDIPMEQVILVSYKKKDILP